MEKIVCAYGLEGLILLKCWYYTKQYTLFDAILTKISIVFFTKWNTEIKHIMLKC